MLRNLLLVLEYDGTRYAGWQRQRDRVTVQGVLESSLSSILGHPTVTVASGRTDAGVHALGQVVGFTTEKPIDCETLHKALQALLPDDMRVLRVQEAPLDFHPRKSAKRKRYVYAVFCGTCPVFLRGYVYSLRQEVDWALVQEGAGLFIGRHDFASFSSPSPRSSVRTVYTLDVEFRFPFVLLGIVAEGFLHHMARMVFGELLLLGMGKVSLADLKHMLTYPSHHAYRRLNLPPWGLYLVEVQYEHWNPYQGLELKDVGFVVPVWVEKNSQKLPPRGFRPC
uniref:tRNA pseudouridine synthase A n=1 Tax=Candidatus Caldatribacterium californiense TaxID=1454726 RepID=A0A7V4DDB7_9BACT